MKLIDLSLEALYGKPKITKSVQEAIAQKENFSKIVPNYCEKVCSLKCKSYKEVTLNHNAVDVLIIQDYKALPDKWKKATQIEDTHIAIIRELAQTHLKGLKYRLTDLFKCTIQPIDIGKGGKPPLYSTISKCSPYLLEEIKQSKPKIIISLSTSVTKAIGLPYSNYSNRGEVHDGVVLTLHPRAVLMIRQNSTGAMWGSDYWEVIARDFNKAGRLARGELKIPKLEDAIEECKKQIHIARSEEDVKRFTDHMAAMFKKNPNIIFSWDSETTGLDPWAPDAKLISMQFGFRDENDKIVAYVFPLFHRENKGYDPAKIFKLYIEPILTGEYLKVGHNAKFDAIYTFVTTKVRVKFLLFDTMLILHAINSGIQGNYGLKRAVWDWIPETGLGGYDDLLPALSRGKEIEEEEISASPETNI